MFASTAEGSTVVDRMTTIRIKSATERNLRLQELDHFTVPVRDVPYVLMTPQTTAGAVKALARLYFRDPDGNQLAVECTSYPLSDRVHVGPFDSSLQAYPWREWRAMVPDGGGPPSEFASSQRSEGNPGAKAPREGWQRPERCGSEDGPWSIDGVHQFPLPVRALGKAEQFYSQVLGTEVVEREAVEISGRQQEALRVSACPGVKLTLVRQEYGWLPPGTTNPHWGFAISAADVETWLEHFAQWNIPYALIVRREYVVPMGVPTRVELHILDPDGNQLELVAWGYPLSDRVERSRYNPWRLAYPYDSWPANT